MFTTKNYSNKMTGSIPKKMFKSMFLFSALIIALTHLTSCARGTYYAAGEDYKYHPERYRKDDTQTMNDPYMRYAHVNKQNNNNCKKPKTRR